MGYATRKACVDSLNRKRGERVDDTDQSASAQKAPLWLLVLTMGCGTVGLTIISPSLKSVAEEFKVEGSVSQLLLSVYYIAIAFSQLVYGPLSDRFGRRNPLLIGMALYAVGGVLGTFAPSMTSLIWARVIQGLGAAAAMSIIRAIINDSYDRLKGAAVLATISAVMVIAPIFSFISGGLIDELIGWKGTMVVIAFAGGISLFMNFIFLSETNLQPLEQIVPRFLIKEYLELFSNKLFLAFVIASACNVGSFLSMIGFFPYEYARLGLSSGEIGFWFALTPLGYMLGNFATSWFTQQKGIETMTLIGSVITLFATGILFSMVLLGHYNLLVIGLIGMLLGFSAGLVIPNATMGAIASAGRLAGSASGITGAVQMGFGVIGGSIIVAVGGYEVFFHGLAILVILAAISVVASVIARSSLLSMKPA